MGKLLKFAKQSELMNIHIVLGKENFDFNLFNELMIEEKKAEIKEQPVIYGFLTTLHKNLIKELSFAEVLQKKAYARAYVKNKRKVGPGGRPLSDDMAKARTELDKKFIRRQTITINIRFSLNLIESCVRSFEQRASLLQTLSANTRKSL